MNTQKTFDTLIITVYTIKFRKINFLVKVEKYFYKLKSQVISTMKYCLRRSTHICSILS